MESKPDEKPKMVCQFWLRGRCQRENCEYAHQGDRPARPSSCGLGLCRAFQMGSCQLGATCRFRHEKPANAPVTSEGANTTATVRSPSPARPVDGIDSDDELILKKGGCSDDNESVASGFTDAPAAFISKHPTEESAGDAIAVPPKDAKDASTLIAAAAADENASGQTGGTPLLTRRVVKASGGTDTETPNKEVRRDSKGFERFEDYFSDSETNNSTNQGLPSESRVTSCSPTREQRKEESSVCDNNVADIPNEATAPPGNGDNAENVNSPQPTMDKNVSDVREECDENGEKLSSNAKTDVSDDKSVEDEGKTLTRLRKRNKDKEDKETIENIENFILEEEKNTSTAGEDKSGVTTKAKSKDEWVTAIFGGDGDKVEDVEGGRRKGGMRQEKSKKGVGNSNVYDLNPQSEDFSSVKETSPFAVKKSETPRSSKDIGQKEGVTKIGNNVYFYSGPNDQDEPTTTEDDDEEEEHFDRKRARTSANDKKDSWTPHPSTPGSRRGGKGKGYLDGRKKHNTNYVYGAKSTATKSRRCGECEGCTREDCGTCVACIDSPKFGGKGNKKQACFYRVCSWKNPGLKRPNLKPTSSPALLMSTSSKTTPSRRGRKTSLDRTRVVAATPAAPEGLKTVDSKRGRKSISVVSPNPVILPMDSHLKDSPQPKDSELPTFDPDTFKPGYTPPVVKKGDAEYAIVVTGVKDTGLCGKYWGDIDNLPPRRRCTMEGNKVAGSRTPESHSNLDKTPDTITLKKQRRKQKMNPKTENSPNEPTSEEIEEEKTVAENTDLAAPKRREQRPSTVAISKTKGSKRKADDENTDETKSPLPTIPSPKKRRNITGDNANSKVLATHDDLKSSNGGEEDGDLRRTMVQKMPQTRNQQQVANSTTETTYSAPRRVASSGAAVVSSSNRSVSCVADTSTQKEVVVECFAPYDDHRWVNIGKERDGMAPDAVQYARALRPPYHLLSFLRIKGHSTKGMSCTDKNTMVFVVLEGEITVVLHTTQFNAKKGDSFYIPPKNYYNLINQKAREAELSLIQFQYDGPLPTVNAASQSGIAKVSAPTVLPSSN